MAPSPDKGIGPGMARIHRRTRHDEDLAGLFGGVLGGDQRARPGGRLDHDDPGGQAADDAVAAREGPGDRRRPERRFGQQEASAAIACCRSAFCGG